MFRCCKRTPEQEFLLDKTIHKKVLVIGRPCIGKTKWVQSIVAFSNEDEYLYNPTIGIDYCSMFYNPSKNQFISPFNIPYDGSYIYKIGVWDCSGDPRFFSIVKSYIEKVNEIWLCVKTEDIHQIQKEIQEWKSVLQFSLSKLFVLHLPSSKFIPFIVGSSTSSSSFARP